MAAGKIASRDFPGNDCRSEALGALSEPEQRKLGLAEVPVHTPDSLPAKDFYSHAGRVGDQRRHHFATD
jgi:hypothetical protein